MRTVLSPTSPLFREARYLLADEPDLHDIGLYHSVLAAIAAGNTHRGGIASYLGRKSGDLAHPLTVLQDCGLVTREPDAFKDNRTTFRIAEPLVTFYHAVMRPIWSDLEHTRDATRLWQRSQRRFTAQRSRPPFRAASPGTGPAIWPRLNCSATTPTSSAPAPSTTPPAGPPTNSTSSPSASTTTTATDCSPSARPSGARPWGLPHLDRLRHIRDLLTTQGRHGAAHARLVCYSGKGFTDDLRRAADQDDSIVLVAIDDLYRPPNH